MQARSIAAGPTRQASASSRLASVADSPQTRSRGSRPRSRASASSVCTPRLVPISSCHSSTTIAPRCAKRSRQSARARNSVRLSGVVTSAVGSRLPWRARAAGPVSPVRTSTVQCGARSAAARARARPVSPASARSGVIQSRVSGGGGVRRSRRDRTAWAATPRHRSCPCRWARGRAPTRRARTPPRPPPGTRTASTPGRRTMRAPGPAGRRGRRRRSAASAAFYRRRGMRPRGGRPAGSRRARGTRPAERWPVGTTCASTAVEPAEVSVPMFGFLTPARRGDPGPLANAAAADKYWQLLPRNDPVAAQRAISEALADLVVLRDPGRDQLRALLDARPAGAPAARRAARELRDAKSAVATAREEVLAVRRRPEPVLRHGIRALSAADPQRAQPARLAGVRAARQRCACSSIGRSNSCCGRS